MVVQRMHGEVEFRFLRPAAQRVFLVGDFNGWNRAALPMQATGDGWWACRLCLPEGSHQFQYLADGKSYLDYAAFGLERGPLGTWNSVVVVGPELGTLERTTAGELAVTGDAPDGHCDVEAWTADTDHPERLPAGKTRSGYQLQEA